MSGLDYQCPRCGLTYKGLTAAALEWVKREHPQHCGHDSGGCAACRTG